MDIHVSSQITRQSCFASLFQSKAISTMKCFFLLTLLMFSLGSICMADPLEGNFQGPADPKSDGTRLPEIKLTFKANGDFTWTLQDKWSTYWYETWVKFPALSGSGSYHYDKSSGQLTVDGSWDGKVESTNIDGAYCRKFRFYTSGDGLTVSSGVRTIVGRAYGYAKYEYEGDTDSGDEEVFVVLQNLDPEPTPTPTPTPTPVPQNNAEYLGNTVPESIATSSVAVVTITMRNSGETAWSAADDYSLAVIQNEGGINVYPRVGIAQDITVHPLEQYSFVAQLETPSTPAQCTLKFRMVKEFVEFFGETETVMINVVPNTGVHNWVLYE